LGLGWLISGKIAKGLLILIGFSAFMALGAFLTAISHGCLGFIVVPLYVAGPIISAIKINEATR